MKPMKRPLLLPTDQRRRETVLTLFPPFSLEGPRFHPVLALHDLPEPEGDVCQVVFWLGSLGLSISFVFPIT